MTNIRPLTPIYTLDDLRPEGEYNEETLRMFMEKLEPTEEDIKRQLTEDELKEICIRYKCRVEAYRWNPVYDYKRCLQRKGTLDCRSTRSQLRHLAKAVNRHKKTIMYDEEEIKKTRDREWRIQKKDNILSLDLWAYQREKLRRKQQEPQTVLIENDSEYDIESDELHQEQPESENMELPLVLSEEPQLPQLTERELVSMEHQALPGALFPSQFTDDDEETERNENFDDELVDIDSELIEAEFNSAELQAIGANKDVCRIFNVNTESMTVYDSEESAAPISSQEQHSDIQSQEVFHKGYEDFGIEVPLTSTQSQKESPEVI